MGLFEYAPGETLGDDETVAVRRVCLDYIRAWYEGDAETMQDVLHPELAKHTLVRLTSTSGPAEYALKPHTAQAMVDMTSKGMGREAPATRRMDVRILAAKHHLASAEVVCHDMTDFLHLVRFPDGWKIVHALWTIEHGQIFDVAKEDSQSR